MVEGLGLNAEYTGRCVGGERGILWDPESEH